MERVPCTPTPECRYYGRCFEDVDHYYYPRRSYKTDIEKQFRNLDENKTLICRSLHDERHATELPPPKPSREAMLIAISRKAITEAA